MPMSNGQLRGQGQHPATTGVSNETDGRSASAVADFSAAAEQAESAAVTQRQREGRKVNMRA